MKEELVSFQVAKLAKEKGFNLPTPKAYINGNLFTNFKESFGESDYYFDADDFHQNWNDKGWVFDVKGNSCFGCSLDNKKYFEAFAAPSADLLQKWLREVHNLHITIDYNKSGKFNCRLCDEVENNLSIKLFGEYFNSYEEALEAGLQKALKLI